MLFDNLLTLSWHALPLWDCNFNINMQQLGGNEALFAVVQLQNGYKVSYVSDTHVREEAHMPIERASSHAWADTHRCAHK